MAIFRGERYAFRTPAQWRMGASENFAVGDDGLSAPAGLGFAPVPGTTKERHVLPVFDPCGHLYWLRAHSGELVRHHGDLGSELVGTLREAERAKDLAIGFEVVWVLAPNALHRHAADSLQYLGSVAAPDGAAIASIARDSGDGLWALLIRGDAGTLHRYDAFGRRCGPEIRIPDLPKDARLAASGRSEWLAILGGAPAEGAPHGRATWRLIIVTPSSGNAKTFDYTTEDGEAVPSLIAIDAEDRIHVTAATKKASGDRAAPTWIRSFAVALAGKEANAEPIVDLIARRRAPLPNRWHVGAMAAWDRIVIAGARGLAWLSEGDSGASEEDEIVSTFITPTLVSPDGLGNRWDAVDLNVIATAGSSIIISVAASRDPLTIAAIDRIHSDPNLSPAERFRALDARIGWIGERDVIYAGSPGEPAVERLRVLLDQLTETHLWLRIRVRSIAGSKPARLLALSVYYPERSYLEFLPAIYRENPASAAELRRFLAPVEALFEVIDEAIDALPRRLDPKTAPPNLPRRNDPTPPVPTWRAFLLRWLGFPAAEILGAQKVKALLDSAPALLAARGTRQALQDVLDILTGGHASVEDSAAMPRPWILPGETNAHAPRLGIDTLVVEATGVPLRLGQGKVGGLLNDWCVDPIALLERRNGAVTITLGVDSADRESLEPVIASFLALFVPAHCRVRVIYVSIAEWRARIGLEGGFLVAGEGDAESLRHGRLAEPQGGRLGSTTNLGGWHLPVPANPPPILDDSAVIGGARLN